ncbi:hypothetical protein PGB90_001550 [Kerria lacca]
MTFKTFLKNELYHRKREFFFLNMFYLNAIRNTDIHFILLTFEFFIIVPSIENFISDPFVLSNILYFLTSL